MRITTWNVNGLRAAIRKGFDDQIASIQPDVLLLQEVRATVNQLPKDWSPPESLPHVHWHPAEKLGYAGTAIFSKYPIKKTHTGMPPDDASDIDGRVLWAEIDVEGTALNAVSIYQPSGSSSEAAQAKKEIWMNAFEPWAAKLQRKRQMVVLGGDFNIAHTERDIFYAKGNAKNSGFLPHERQWITDLLDSGWADVVRDHYGDREGPYSWWSNRGQARALDRGWRIDYLFSNKAATKHFKSATIHREGGMTVSDHAPVSADFKIN